MEDLRSYIRMVLEEQRPNEKVAEDDLLLEPDGSEDEEIEENPLQTISTVLSIAAMAKSLAS